MEPTQKVTVIGAGLAGTECAWQLARRGIPVVLREMKPVRRSPAHKSDSMAELVCSNSFRSDAPDSAVGMLHAELRQLGSVVLGSADENRVPAGEALAVDRDRFSATVSERVRTSPLIRIEQGEVDAIPDGLVVIATGPLTSDALTGALEPFVGERLYFYDSIAPIVSADSVDMNVAFRASRWGKGSGDDYLNLPMSKEEYYRFVEAVRAGQKLEPHSFEEPKYFEGCLPIEVMVERGDDVLAHGPLKPVGLVDPRTGQRPYAVIQLRMEDAAGTSFNMVGFQTRLTWPEQKRIFRELVPGLQNAEFLRMGQIHRNTFIDAPRLLSPELSLRNEARIFFAGQITGVEGYVESAACGYLTALSAYARLKGSPFVPPPATTAMGSLYRHVTGEAHPPNYNYQPSNVIFGLFPPLEGRVKREHKRARYAERATRDFGPWLSSIQEAV